MTQIHIKLSGENNVPSYDPEYVKPFREELTRVGFKELLTPEDIDIELNCKDDKVVLLLLNSVCGCAASSARPGTIFSLIHHLIPDKFVTLFAGMEKDAVTYFREKYLPGLPPSSPNIVFLKNGQLLLILQRQNIEGRTAFEIAGELTEVYNTICNKKQTDEEAAELINYVAINYQVNIESLKQISK